MQFSTNRRGEKPGVENGHKQRFSTLFFQQKNAGRSADRPALLYSLHHIAEHQLCDLEIEDQAAGVHDGGDEGGSHNSGVGTQLFGGKRQHTAQDRKSVV